VHQTIHFGLCTALISRALELISNCKCSVKCCWPYKQLVISNQIFISIVSTELASSSKVTLFSPTTTQTSLAPPLKKKTNLVWEISCNDIFFDGRLVAWSEVQTMKPEVPGPIVSRSFWDEQLYLFTNHGCLYTLLSIWLIYMKDLCTRMFIRYLYQ
jgi:hypothetical protein